MNSRSDPQRPIYLDHAATTPMRREVLEAMFPYFQQVYANPSSVHEGGAESARALAEVRNEVASILHAHPEEIVFTSGGTESDNLAVIGTAEAARNVGDHVIVSSIEHEAVLEGAEELRRRGFRVSVAPVDSRGRIDPAVVASMVEPTTVLVSCMYANNEIGTIEPVAEIARLVRQANPRTRIHTDAVQAAGALPLSVRDLGVDLLSLSGHKIYGPHGTGVLFVRRGIPITPLVFGGGQERGLRSGTENVPGAVGFARALSLAESERISESDRLTQLRNRLVRGIRESCQGIEVTGDPIERLPGHASFLLLERSAESVLVDLDVRGIMCSSGSACHAGQTDPSHVLLALGLDRDKAGNGLRMTLGRETSESDVDRVIGATREVFGRHEARVGGH